MARLSLPSKPAGYSFPSIVRPPLVQSDMPSIWFTLVGLRLSSPLRIDSGGTLIQRGQMPRAVMPRLQARGHLPHLASLSLRCKISCRLPSSWASHIPLRQPRGTHFGRRSGLKICPKRSLTRSKLTRGFFPEPKVSQLRYISQLPNRPSFDIAFVR